MASISKYLETIKNAIYGRDMRSAIHDSIKTVNDDVEIRLSREGGTMTGRIAMNDNKVTSSAMPSSDDDYTNKKYVDAKDNEKANRDEVPILDTDGKVPDEKLHNPIKNLTDGTAPKSLETPNSQAISEGAVALGKNSIAGSKCFNITAFDDTNKSYTLDSVEGLEVGDVYSLKLYFNYDKVGTITAIDGNVVTVSDYYHDEWEADNYLFRVPEKPNCGTTDFGIGALAGGEDSIAQGDDAFTWSKGGKSHGRYAVTFGLNTEAGYAGFVQGGYVKALSIYGFGFGYDNIVKREAIHGSVFGRGLISSVPYQCVRGSYNVEDTLGQYLDIFGNGTSKTKRSNAYALDKYGNGWFAGDIESAKYGALSEKLSSKEAANAVKNTKDGTNIVIDDISPLAHDVAVLVNMPNVLSYPYNDTTKTVGGITFTDNEDGTITANGTSKYSRFVLRQGTQFETGTFVISGCPKGGTNETYDIHLTLYKNNQLVKSFYDFGSGTKPFNCSDYDYDKYIFAIHIYNGTTINNLVFRPKLSLLPNTTALTVKGENDEVQATYTPNADGSVSGVKSVYPIMKLELSDTNADMTVEYNKDVNTALSDKADKELAFNDIITIKRYSSHDEDSTITWDSCDELDSVTGDGVYIVNAISNHHGYRVVTRKTLYAILFVQSVSGTGDPYNPDTVKYTQTLVTADGQTLTRSGTMSGSELTWGAFTDVVKDSIILKSSTAESNKKFKITVNNSGTLSTTEITD